MKSFINWRMHQSLIATRDKRGWAGGQLAGRPAACLVELLQALVYLAIEF